MNDIEYIRNKLDLSALLAQLAEEASELSQAALKCRRHEEGRNLPSKDAEECWKNLKEEIADILLVCSVLDINCMGAEIIETMYYKKSRWAVRLRVEEANHANETL